MTSTFTANKSFEEPGYNDYVNSWNTPINANFSIVDQALGGTTPLNVTGISGTVTLTSAQYRPIYIYVAGTLTANVTYQFPAGVGGMWVVTNATTGAFTLSFTGGSSTLTIPQGITDTIFNNQLGYTFRTTPSGQPGGANTQVQFNSSGAFAGSPNLTWDGASLTTLGSSGAYSRMYASGTVSTATGGAANSLSLQKDSISGNFLSFYYGSLTGSPSPVGAITTDGTSVHLVGSADYATSAGSAAASLVANTATTATTATNVTNLTSAQVGTATAGLSAGAVGTYAMAKYLGSTAITFGGTVSGNMLVPCDATGTIVGSMFSSGQTWQCMGRVDPVSFETPYIVTSWLRVS